MKILCVSDEIDPFIYNSSVKQVFGDVDAVFCAGDLPMDYIDFIVSTLNKPTYFVFGNHNLKEYKYYHKDKSSSTVSYANSMQAAAAHGHGAIYAGFKCFSDKSLMITDPHTKKQRPILMAGVDGCMLYNHGLCQYSELNMAFRLLAFIPKLLFNKIRYGVFLDVFLTHAAPRHIHDKDDPCHKGFECFERFIKKYKPAYMVHGHIHLYDQNEERVGVYHNTTVVNAYSHHIIEI